MNKLVSRAICRNVRILLWIISVASKLGSVQHYKTWSRLSVFINRRTPSELSHNHARMNACVHERSRRSLTHAHTHTRSCAHALYAVFLHVVAIILFSLSQLLAPTRTLASCGLGALWDEERNMSADWKASGVHVIQNIELEGNLSPHWVLFYHLATHPHSWIKSHSLCNTPHNLGCEFTELWLEHF